MSSREEIRDALVSVIDPGDSVVVLHSSLAMLRPPADVGKWDFLYAIRGLLARGHTVAVPAFTFSSCRGTPFLPAVSPSEVGVLADWCGELPEFRRTSHPIYSFQVAGPLADRVLDCANTTTFGDDSSFALFERENARIVMLGCGWTYCTQFHRYEEEARVPYRLYKDFPCVVRDQPVQARMFVRDLWIDADNDFSGVVTAMAEAKALRSVSLWSGQVDSASCAAVADICRAQLAADPLAFTVGAPVVARRVRQAAARAKSPPLKVAILGHANLALVETAVAADLAAQMADRVVETYCVPFGQLAREVFDAESALNRFAADVAFFLDRPQDLLGMPDLDGVDPAVLGDALARYAEIIETYRERHGGPIVAARPNRLGTTSFGQADGVAGGFADVLRQCADSFATRLAHLADFHLLDLAELAADHEGPVSDARLWFLGRFPFSDGFSRRLASWMEGCVLASAGRTARLLVVDLDNTMWGGVLGEDGPGGLHVGGDYPGNAFAAFQRLLKRLSERGVALAVCSKNDEEPALEAMRTLPSMLVRPDDLVGHRINWRPKAENVRELAEELNLGLENVLFIDDNPVEREQMRRNLPEVKVLDLPQDPAFYVQALLRSPWVQALTLTHEDRQRVESYKARARIESSRRTAANGEDFFASLETRLYLQPLDDGNITRAAQLLSKTNQFNTTTRRHDRTDLARMVAEGAWVVVIGAEDRYSPRENVGVLIVHWDTPEPGWGTVDSYLLSCRVLGRGLETGILHWLADAARARGAKGLFGEVIETERNTPARRVFADAGWAPVVEGRQWRLTMDDVNRVPTWLRIADRVSKVVAE